MKKKILLIVAVMALFSSVASAQWKYGGGLTLGTKMGINDSGDNKMGFGINGRADYTINEKFSASGGLTYFFPSVPDGLDLDAWKINVDGHYSLLKDDTKNVYALAGLAYDYAKVKVSYEGYSASSDESEIAFELGGGIGVDMYFGELKYDTSYEQVEITIGVLF